MCILHIREIYKPFSEHKSLVQKGAFLCKKLKTQKQKNAALLPNAKTMSFVMSVRRWYYVDKRKFNRTVGCGTFGR